MDSERVGGTGRAEAKAGSKELAVISRTLKGAVARPSFLSQPHRL